MNDQSNSNEIYYTRGQDYEVEIDILNLLGHSLIRWKLILAVGLVCAVIGGVIGFVRFRSKDPIGEEAISIAAENLTEIQKDEAEKYYEQMVKYDQAIEDQKKMYDESYYINLDPYTAVGSHLWYMLETDLGNASSVYTDMLNDDDYYKIADILGTDINRKYLKEIVTFWSDETMDTYKFNLSNTDRQMGDIKNEYKLLLKMTVTAPDRASCDKITQIADEAVNRETEVLEKYGVSIKCTKLASRTYDTEVTERIIGNQQAKINALGNLETIRGNFYNSVVTRVGTDEKAYFEALYMAAKDDSSKDIQEDVAVKKMPWKKTLKYVIVAAFAGVFVTFCLISAIYIFGGKLHVADEVNCMGIPVLQTLYARSHDKLHLGNDILSRWASVLMGVNRYNSGSFSVLMEELAKKTEREPKYTYIAIDRSSPEAMEYAQKISNGSTGNVTYYIGGIVPDADDMRQLLESDSVLLLPVIELTKTKCIAVLAEICTRNRIHIIGSAPVVTEAR